MIFSNILETIGNTPIVRITRLAPEGVELFVKCESFNPMGSVKDRLALSVIEAAERDGSLRPGQTVIEATSGNTGIGLAMVCAQKGYPLVVTMAESFSVERRRLMRFLGAKVVLTPASEKGSGMLAKAVELAEKHGWFLARQFENEANADIHSRTTAPEILSALPELDYWVTGYGTGGTLKGVARVLKEKSPHTRVVVCEPDNVPVLASGIPQPHNPDGSVKSHVKFSPHPMQGWTPDFIPKLAEDARQLIDEFVGVNGADAFQACRDLAQKEGILTGISGGATFAGALKVAASAPSGSSVLAMLPDTGERYLSTPLFEDVPVEMTPEEIAISQSTPRHHFGSAKESAEQKKESTTPEAEAFVDDMIRQHPVMLFALEWCEFCWSVKKMFTQMKIPFEFVDLDSVQFQKDDLGKKVRAVLAARTGQVTIPQVFINAEHIGGCTELFSLQKEGRLISLLEKNTIPFDDKERSFDPFTLFPKWLHPR